MLELESSAAALLAICTASLLCVPFSFFVRISSHIRYFNILFYTVWYVIARMRLFTTLGVLAVAALASARSPQHVGKSLPELRPRAPPVVRALHELEVGKRAASPFATAKTKSTVVNVDQPSSKLTCYRIFCQWHSASPGGLQHWYATC